MSNFESLADYYLSQGHTIQQSILLAQESLNGIKEALAACDLIDAITPDDRTNRRREWQMSFAE